MTEQDDLYLLKVDGFLYWDRHDRPLSLSQIEQHLEKTKAILREAAVHKRGGRDPLAGSVFDRLMDRLEEKRTETVTNAGPRRT